MVIAGLLAFTVVTAPAESSCSIPPPLPAMPLPLNITIRPPSGSVTAVCTGDQDIAGSRSCWFGVFSILPMVASCAGVALGPASFRIRGDRRKLRGSEALYVGAGAEPSEE